MAKSPEGDDSDSRGRAGEIALEHDPAAMAGDAHVVFIGRARTPWTRREDCPRNMAAAREAGREASIEIDAPYRAGLAGLAGFSHVVVLTWLAEVPRDLIVQTPRHTGEPKGVFALRSPARPNPVGLHVAALRALDAEAGRLMLDALDVLDGTAVIDVKPYFATNDAFPDASRPADRTKG